VSANGIKRTVFELLCNNAEKYDRNIYKDDKFNKNYVSPLRQISFANLSGKDIDKEARNGDSIALKAYEATGHILGKSLADMAAITSPTHIFLFGGLAEARELILNPTVEAFDKNMLFCFKNNDKPKAKIVLSNLSNQNIGILGAAALIWKDIY
jgi:glucokinase